MMQRPFSNGKKNIHIFLLSIFKKALSREKDLHVCFSNTLTPVNVLVLHDVISLRKLLVLRKHCHVKRICTFIRNLFVEYTYSGQCGYKPKIKNKLQTKKG